MRSVLISVLGLCVGLTNTTLHASDDTKLIPTPDPQLVVDAQGFSGVPVKALSISPDGKWLAAVGGKQARIWNLTTGMLHTSLRGYQEPGAHKLGRVNDVAFSPCGRFLLVGISDSTELGSTRVYAMDDLTRIHKLLPGHTGCTLGVEFSPDGTKLATYGCDGHIYIFEWLEEEGDARAFLDVPDIFGKGMQVDNIPYSYFGFPVDENWLVLRSPCTDKLVVSLRDKGLISADNMDQWPASIRNLEKEEDRIRLANTQTMPQFTTPGKIQNDGYYRYARGGMTQNPLQPTNYWIGLWRQGSSRPATLYTKHCYLPTAVSLNEDANGGDGLAASADAIGEIHVWNARTGKQLHHFRPKSRPIYGVAWSDDGKSLQFADEAYGQEQYNYNRCGPTDKRFDLLRRHEADVQAAPDKPAYPTRRSPWDNSRLSFDRTPATDDDGNVVNGIMNLSVLRDGREFKSFRTFGFGNPYSFIFGNDTLLDGKLCPVFIGSETGRLAMLGVPGPQNANAWGIAKEYLGHLNTITAIEESPDKTLLATSSLDGTIRIWPITSNRDLADLDVIMDGNRVYSVPPGSYGEAAGLQAKDEIVSFAGQPYYSRVPRMMRGEFREGQMVELRIRRKERFAWVFAGTATKTINVRLAKRPDILEPILSLFFAEDGEWVAWTRGGFYDASSRGGQYVGWHVNQEREMPADFYSVDQFAPVLYRPDVISEVVRQGNCENALAMANQSLKRQSVKPPAPINFTDRKEFDENRPPRIRFVEPRMEMTTDNPSLTIQAEVGSIPQVGLKEVSLRINGRPVDPYIETDSRTDGDLVWKKCTQTVDLTPGENQIVFTAVNYKSLSASRVLLVNRRVTQPEILKPSELPNLYVLAIGISRYMKSKYNLEFAHRDAIDFADAWKSQEGKMYRQVHTRVLTDEDATADNIRKAMDWVSKNVEPGKDVVLIQLSGHGAFNSGLWHLIPHDFDPDDLRNTTISRSTLTDWIERELRTNVIMFVDTCHSGGIKGTKGLEVVAPMGREHWQGTGTLIFASSMSSELSIESNAWQHGAFTQAILDTLSAPEADVDGDGTLNFTELELSVKTRVRRMTGNEQNPTAHKPMSVSEVNLAVLP